METLRLSGVEDVPLEERLHVQLPPCTDLARVTSNWSLGSGASREIPDSVRRATAEAHLSTLPTDATWIWSDGSAERDTTGGGGGALLVLRSGYSQEVRVAAGSLCSSSRAELFAVRAALEEVSELTGDQATEPVVLCTDPQAALALLAGGALTQETTLGAAIWTLLGNIAARDQDIFLQWVPAHCGLPGNERAGALANWRQVALLRRPRRTSAPSPELCPAPLPMCGGSRGRTDYSERSGAIACRDLSLAKTGRRRRTHTSCELATTAARAIIYAESEDSPIAPTVPTGATPVIVKSARGLSVLAAERRQTRLSTCCYAARALPEHDYEYSATLTSNRRSCGTTTP